jgi:capsular exopolysaccharide synthesis family protein
MAKVYDALKRAEAERQRRAGREPEEASAPLDWEPEASPPSSVPVPREAGAPRPSLLKRLFGKSELDSVGDLNKRRISILQPDSYVAEQFQALRGRIDAIGAQRPIKSVAMTSAMPGEGKTTASVNLAVVTSLSLDRKVLLIDCDLRRPKVHRALGLQPEFGLAEVLSGDCSLDDAIIQVEGMNLHVLAVRNRPSNPSELLGSAQMAELVKRASERYDRVVVDTPAALGLPDAKSVADLCDGIVMVVRADETRQEDAQMVLEILDRSRVLGVVLNGAVVDQGRYGYAT